MAKPLARYGAMGARFASGCATKDDATKWDTALPARLAQLDRG
jgi:hypothetical protein